MRLANSEPERHNEADDLPMDQGATHLDAAGGDRRRRKVVTVTNEPGERDSRDQINTLRLRLAADLDGLLTQTRARLTRLARARGVPPDVVDDVVQETLLEAWRSLDRLTAPSGFSPWIDEICRNVSRRAAVRRARDLVRLGPLPLRLSGQDVEEDAIDRLANAAVLASDPMADLIEDLSRQDLVTLLDRALDVLPIETRRLVEMCHLRGLPHSEVAARLGIASGTLDTRLSRARRQLHQALNGPLRHEAVAFGLALDDERPESWEETRLWCPVCARSRLQGAFMAFEGPDGGPNLHLRCPACARRYGRDAIHTMGLIPLTGLRSYRPAWKHAMQGLSDHMARALQSGHYNCGNCGKPASVKVAAARGGVSPLPFHIRMRCASCGQDDDLSGGFPGVDQIVYWSHPLTRQFVLEHDHWRSQFSELVERDGALTIPLTLSDANSGARVTVLAERHTLRVLTLA